MGSRDRLRTVGKTIVDKPPVKDLLKFILTEEDKPGASQSLKNSVMVENSCSSKNVILL